MQKRSEHLRGNSLGLHVQSALTPCFSFCTQGVYIIMLADFVVIISPYTGVHSVEDGSFSVLFSVLEQNVVGHFDNLAGSSTLIRIIIF